MDALLSDLAVMEITNRPTEDEECMREALKFLLDQPEVDGLLFYDGPDDQSIASKYNTNEAHSNLLKLSLEASAKDPFKSMSRTRAREIIHARVQGVAKNHSSIPIRKRLATKLEKARARKGL